MILSPKYKELIFMAIFLLHCAEARNPTQSEDMPNIDDSVDFSEVLSTNTSKEKEGELQPASSNVAVNNVKSGIVSTEEPPKFLSFEQAQADTKQLITILEETHTDPYLPFGGKIIFQSEVNKLKDSLPREHISRGDFAVLLNRFLSQLGDLHTRIFINQKHAVFQLGRMPMSFQVVAEGLSIAAFNDQRLKEVIGFLLDDIEGIPVDGMIDIISENFPFENRYGGLVELARVLSDKAKLLELLRKNAETPALSFGFISPDGTNKRIKVNIRQTVPLSMKKWSYPPKNTSVFEPRNEIVWWGRRKVPSFAYLRVNIMAEREALEIYKNFPIDIRQEIEWAYSYTDKTPSPRNDEAIAALPRFSEITYALLSEMKENQTQALIVDLRGNPGGNGLIFESFLYYLWGHLASGRPDVSSSVTRLSKRYLKQRSTTIKDVIEENDDTSLEVGSYLFHSDSEESTDRETKLFEDIKKYIPSVYAEMRKQKETPVYKPKQIVVLVDTNTGSAAFDFEVALKQLGVSIVGLPSGQSPNTNMEQLSFELDHSKWKGGISSRYVGSLDNPSSRVFEVDFPITAAIANRYYLDNNTALLYALDLIKNGSLNSKP